MDRDDGWCRMAISSMTLCLFLVAPEVDGRVAFVSTLTSNSFTLAARVLAHSVKKHHPDVEYVVLYTDDVSNASISLLEESKIEMKRITKIDTPYLETHRETKFQYTKVQLWALTDYATLVHLDLDTILTGKVSELFTCPGFCAALRHSDMFNSGVFVLKPNVKTYHDMLNLINRTLSYDGGDQGFFNSYFDQLKAAPMLGAESKCGGTLRRLSSTYNYDVGIYYLRSKALVPYKIIHYTMGFLKPWFWFAYPLFDMNWQWLEVRLAVHGKGEELSREYVRGCLQLVLAVGSVALVHATLIPLKWAAPCCGRCQSASEAEKKTLVVSALVLGVMAGFSLTPTQLLPPLGWAHFTVYMVLAISTVTAFYSKIRFGSSQGPQFTLRFMLFLSVTHMLLWTVLINIGKPSIRFVTFVAFICIYVTVLYHTLYVTVFNDWKRRQPKRTTANVRLDYELERLTAEKR